jgi:hypothetical protein
MAEKHFSRRSALALLGAMMTDIPKTLAEETVPAEPSKIVPN